MKSLTLLLLGLLVHANPAWAATCKEQFVACVQQTGDPFSCRSTFVNCEENETARDAPQAEQSRSRNTSDANASNDILSVRVKSGERLPTIELIGTNATSSPISIERADYDITCNDGSIDRAVFFISANLPPNTKDAMLGQQYICLSAGGIRQIDNNPTIYGGASSVAELEFEIPCANNIWTRSSVIFNQRGFYRAVAENGTTLRGRDAFTFDDLAGAACEAPAEPALFQRAKSVVNKVLTDWTKQSDKSGKVIYDRRYVATGVRG